MKTLIPAFLLVACLASAASAAPDPCRELQAKYEADNPGTNKVGPEARACLLARLEAKKREALAERARIDANIAEMERNAPKLPAE